MYRLVEPDGDRQLCAGGRLLLLEKQGLRKPKCESGEVAKRLKKATGRHPKQVLGNRQDCIAPSFIPQAVYTQPPTSAPDPLADVLR